MTTPEFNADEIRRMGAERGLTEMETDTALMIFAGRAAFPLRNYCQQVRHLVAELRERQTAQKEIRP
jgi:hypothetical protein